MTTFHFWLNLNIHEKAYQGPPTSNCKRHWKVLVSEGVDTFDDAANVLSVPPCTVRWLDPTNDVNYIRRFGLPWLWRKRRWEVEKIQGIAWTCRSTIQANQICKHNKQKSRCKDCGRSEVCEHNKIRSHCKGCGGSQICEHNKRRSRCQDCGGSKVCEHNKIRSRWKDCNPLGYLVEVIWGRVYIALKNDKEMSSTEYLGCNIKMFKKHIEQQFTGGMSWENYGEWHIHHKIPLKYNKPSLEEVAQWLHYTNTQPIWVSESISKGCRYISGGSPARASNKKRMTGYIKELHTAIFTGQTKCGKTHLVLELIEKEYNKHFDYIVIICPTLRENSTYHAKEWIKNDDNVWLVDPQDKLYKSCQNCYDP